jgi:hypothetical protein
MLYTNVIMKSETYYYSGLNECYVKTRGSRTHDLHAFYLSCLLFLCSSVWYEVVYCEWIR